MKIGKELLKVNNLKVSMFFKRGVAKILRNISFTLNCGEIISIAGESGCGKTITVLSIAGLLPNPPAKIVGGNIFYNNIDLTMLSDRERLKLRKRNISMVFQDPFSFLDPMFKVGEQILEVVMLNNREIDKGEARKKSIELLRKVGISDPEKRYFSYPHQLSGGMAQRVMIAIAIASQPRLLICDEATSALDVTTQKQVLIFLKEFSEKNVSIIFVSHDLSVVSEVSDKVIIMYAGEVMEVIPGECLFTKPIHPYTKALIKSLPIFGIEKRRLYTIRGVLPSIFEERAGCGFVERCKYSKKDCFEKEIELRPVGKGHFVRCLI